MAIEILKAVILGVVEGVTEFLPISSTGHLILVNQFLSFERGFTILFDIVIQLGAILAVVVYFWKKLWPFGADRSANRQTWRIWSKILVAVLPALILGALLGDFVEEKLFDPLVVAVSLLVGGIIIIWIENRSADSTNLPQSNLQKVRSVGEMSFKTAFLIGLAQCLALIPGVSRAAATIVGGLVFGASRPTATQFSFFLAIPTMLAASAYSLFKYDASFTSSRFLILAVGFVVSFLVALAVVKWLIGFVSRRSFVPFGWYRVILALFILLILGV